MSRFFIDTNIIVYANDARDEQKQIRALEVVAEHMKAGTGVISTQVLQEYAHVALNKLHQRQDVVLRQLVLLEELNVIQQSPALIRRAVEIKAAYQVSFTQALLCKTHSLLSGRLKWQRAMLMLASICSICEHTPHGKRIIICNGLSDLEIN